MMFNELDKLKAKLDALRPLPKHTVKSLHEQLVLDWTYNSNAIEGNTLTLKETKVVLEGITVGGKSMREHLEAINHKEAIGFVGDVIEKKEPLSESLIKSIHYLVLKQIDNENAGVYRQQNVVIYLVQSIDHRTVFLFQVKCRYWWSVTINLICILLSQRLGYTLIL